MSNSKMLERLKLRRFCSQYEYLEYELDETRYLFEKYNKRFLEENYKENTISESDTNPRSETNIPNMPMEIHVYTGEENIGRGVEDACGEDACEEDELLLDELLSEEDVNIRRLYRRLSLKTHPDKPGGDKESFEEVNTAFKNKDFLKLLLLASRYNIDIEDINISMDNFEKNISELKEKINNFKKTLAWNWANATPEQKELYKRQFGLK